MPLSEHLKLGSSLLFVLIHFIIYFLILAGPSSIRRCSTCPYDVPHITCFFIEFLHLKPSVSIIAWDTIAASLIRALLLFILVVLIIVVLFILFILHSSPINLVTRFILIIRNVVRWACMALSIDLTLMILTLLPDCGYLLVYYVIDVFSTHVLIVWQFLFMLLLLSIRSTLRVSEMQLVDLVISS